MHARIANVSNTQKNLFQTFHPLVQMQLTKRRKNSIFTFVIRLGGVAQLVERLNGIQEVRGSTPLISTTYKKTNPILSGSFSFRGLCTAMPCRLRREPLRAGAAFMRVNSLTSLLRKRCLLRPPHLHQTKKSDEHWVTGSSDFFFCHPKSPFDTTFDTNIICSGTTLDIILF